MRIENGEEAPETMHIVLDDPDDQVYVTYQGVTISIYLSEDLPERAFHPNPIVLDVMTEDDLVLTHAHPTEPGDGLRACFNGRIHERFDRTYLKEI